MSRYVVLVRRVEECAGWRRTVGSVSEGPRAADAALVAEKAVLRPPLSTGRCDDSLAVPEERVAAVLRLLNEAA